MDLADYGTDNLVALAWDGFHAYDILILSKSTPRENAMAVKTFAFEHGTAESHIIFDATAGRYFNDYIPDAVPYISLNKPFGLYLTHRNDSQGYVLYQTMQDDRIGQFHL